MKNRNELKISERELNEMTKDLDEAHHASLPQLREAVAEFSDNLRSGSGFNRRNFLVGASVVGGGVALAACGSSKSKSSGSTATTAAGGSGDTGGGGGGGAATDLKVAGLAASLENLAVQTYQAGLDAATAGKLGTVPPAVATFATTAQSQHKDHAAAWNSILTGASKPAVTGVDKTIQDKVVTPAFAQVKDIPGLAKLALTLENSAAATYLAGITLLSSKDAIKIAATIQPVEMQHAAILNFVLGQYPVPVSFATTDGAASPDDQIG